MKFTAIPANLTVLFFLVGGAVVPRGESQAAPMPPGWINFMPGPSLQHWTRIAIPPKRPLS